ncbi:Hypothetical protein CINCED_3A000704 [Cinara cedri]|uniref:Uncharacterized protein n=1 Tax=Cinara cedri TaxID=506608 RepID=A0A5E4MEU5_9HEMI|nr:Hypothetical protein CINCED_3A000704 [Cinara cedri]
MNHENRKRRYFDKLKKASYELRNENIGGLDTQSDNSWYESLRQDDESKIEVQINDILAKIQRYNKVNPSSYITKKGLRNINRGLHQRVIRSNTVHRNQLTNANKMNNDVQNVENVISFTKPKQELVDYKDDSVKFGLPIANSTINNLQSQHFSILQKQNDKPITGCEINKHTMAKKSQVYQNSPSDLTNLSGFNSSKMTRTSDIRELPILSSDSVINKNKPISKKEKAKLNLEFSYSHFDEIKRISKNGYLNNDYVLSKIKQSQIVSKKKQHKQEVNDTNLINISMPFINDTLDSFKITSSNISSDSDFVFKPLINFSNNEDILCTSQFSEDSFVCSNLEDSMDDDQFKLQINNEWFSSPDSSMSENYSHYHRQTLYYESNLTNLTSFNSSSDDSLK